MVQFRWKLAVFNRRVKAKVEKGNPKTKGLPKDNQNSKGKSKGNDSKGSKGSAGDRSKGKSKGEVRQCYHCGRAGHMARDCWQPQVRNTSTDSTQVSTAQGLPTSSVSVNSSVSQQPGAQQQSSSQTTQMRVSRICEITEVNDDVEVHDDLVVDIRDSSPASFHGNIHVAHFFIGDVSDDEFSCSGVVRTVGRNDSEKLHAILLDSGAAASIFPVSLLRKGHKVHNAIGKLHDAR